MTIFKGLRFHTLIFLAFAQLASAGILEMKPGEKSIEGVKLAKEAIFQFEGKPVILKPYASGIRKKKIAVFWAKVYVGQIFAPEGLAVPPPSISAAFETLSKQRVVALVMTFLRDVDTSRQKAAFEDALEKNSVNPNSAPMKPLFEIVQKAGDAKDTLSTTIVFEHRKDSSDWIYYENGRGELQSRALDKGVLSNVLAIWVGKPADSGMERLHKQFLGQDDD